MIKPIVKVVEVPASAAQAFKMFTENVATWWPMDKHSVSAGQGKRSRDVVFEPTEGGAAYEIMHDGTRTEWGTVVLWEPGQAVGLIWHPGKDAGQATRLDITFADLGAGRSRVTLTHSGWEVLADAADEARGHYSSGWDHVLGDCYIGAF